MWLNVSQRLIVFWIITVGGGFTTEIHAKDLPSSGERVPELVAFDKAMQSFMKERSIQAGVLAIMKDSQLIYERGFGWANPSKKKVIEPNVLFRIASLTKPITAAAVKQLIREKKVLPTTKVFPLLKRKVPRSVRVDPRLNDITVQHLIEHKGGWDKSKTFDPTWHPQKVTTALGIKGAVKTTHIVRYIMGQPLQFDPGMQRCYSNVGYLLLGMVVQKVSDTSFITYVRDNLLKPHGISNIYLARTRKKYRRPNEVWYYHPGRANNVLNPASKKSVLWPYGGFYVEQRASYGGLICSVGDYARFMQAYSMYGDPRDNSDNSSFYHFGSQPGTYTTAIWRKDGINIAVFFNQRKDPSKLDYKSIRKILNDVCDRIEQWPVVIDASVDNVSIES